MHNLMNSDDTMTSFFLYLLKHCVLALHIHIVFVFSVIIFS